jgi:hypothetical protein
VVRPDYERPPRAESRFLKLFGAAVAAVGALLVRGLGETVIYEPSPALIFAFCVALNVAALGIFLIGAGMMGSLGRGRTWIGLLLKQAGVNLLVPMAVGSLLLGASLGLRPFVPGRLPTLDLLASMPAMMVPATVLYILGSHAVGFVGMWLIKRGFRCDALTAEEILATDSRTPVLYLRTFGDDDTHMFNRRLRAWLWLHPTSLEQDLVAVLGRMGPVVTVGRPGEGLPQLGAARVYFDDAEWRERVCAAMAKAAFIVIRSGTSPSLWWEIEQAMKVSTPSRVFILSVGSDDQRRTFEGELEQRLGRPGALTGLPPIRTPFWLRVVLWGRNRFGRLISFGDDWVPSTEPIQAGFHPLRPFQIYFQFTPFRGPLVSAFQATFEKSQRQWPRVERSRGVAIVLALIWGMFGAHNFYLRRWRRGVASLLLCWTMVPALLSWLFILRVLWTTRHQFSLRYPRDGLGATTDNESFRKLVPPRVTDGQQQHQPPSKPQSAGWGAESTLSSTSSQTGE